MKIIFDRSEKVFIMDSTVKYIHSIYATGPFFTRKPYTSLTWGDTDSTDMQLSIIIALRKDIVSCDELRDLNERLNLFFGNAITAPVCCTYSASSDGVIRVKVEFKSEFEPCLTFLNKLNNS